MKTLNYCAAVAALGAATIATSRATIFVWNFDSPQNVAVTGPHAYADANTGTVNLTADGFVTQFAAPANSVVGDTWNTGTISGNDLYQKHTNGDPGETGLGLDKLNSDHEIEPKSYVQLDLSDLFAHGLPFLTLSISSIQEHEGYFVWGSNDANSPGTLLMVGHNPQQGGVVQTILVPDYGTYRYVSISAARRDGDSDVLIQNGATASPVPEPASMLALGGGAVALLRRRNRA